MCQWQQSRDLYLPAPTLFLILDWLGLQPLEGGDALDVCDVCVELVRGLLVLIPSAVESDTHAQRHTADT